MYILNTYLYCIILSVSVGDKLCIYTLFILLRWYDETNMGALIRLRVLKKCNNIIQALKCLKELGFLF